MGCINSDNYNPNVHNILGSYTSLEDCQNNCTQSTEFVGNIGKEIIQELQDQGIEIPTMWIEK